VTDFDATPLILTGNLYRAANVSATRGDRALQELVAVGAVRPVRTPTGRVLLSPADGKRVFAAITKAA
jgi:hypothetical protein